MLQAILQGKISRSVENLEDLLTSNVFGAFRYLRPEEGLLRFIAQAQSDASGDNRPLRFLGCVESHAATHVEYCFWPQWQYEGCLLCEPDVVIKISLGDNRSLWILIEAKYQSEKSSVAQPSEERPTDQLACEWDNLVVAAKKAGAEPYLIYLTADIGFPTEAISSSATEYLSKRPEGQKPELLWLSWRMIPEIYRVNSECLLLYDLVSLCRRCGLQFFHGFEQAPATPPITWRFNTLPERWTMLSEALTIGWRMRRDV